MFIRSQDKKKITNLNQVTDLVVSYSSINKEWDIIACYSYFADTDCGYATIATYSTEEKALKVLDMICNFLTSKHYENVVPTQCGFIEGIVFEIPKDSDVNQNSRS